jgi:hypothetical protein
MDGSKWSAVTFLILMAVYTPLGENHFVIALLTVCHMVLAGTVVHVVPVQRAMGTRNMPSLAMCGSIERVR